MTLVIEHVPTIGIDNLIGRFWINQSMIGPKLRHSLILRILNDAFFAWARQIGKLSTKNKVISNLAPPKGYMTDDVSDSR